MVVVPVVDQVACREVCLVVYLVVDRGATGLGARQVAHVMVVGTSLGVSLVVDLGNTETFSYMNSMKTSISLI